MVDRFLRLSDSEDFSGQWLLQYSNLGGASIRSDTQSVKGLLHETRESVLICLVLHTLATQVTSTSMSKQPSEQRHFFW